jgi:hypothetical protein
MAKHKTADAKELTVKAEPIGVSVGVDSSIMAAGPRPDLNGLRVKLPNQATIWLIMDGYRHGIPNPATYNNLFRDWNGIVIDINVVEIPEVAPISNGALLAKSNTSAAVYLVTNGVKRWVTSPAAMDKYYFAWNRIVTVPFVLVDFIPTGASIS